MATDLSVRPFRVQPHIPVIISRPFAFVINPVLLPLPLSLYSLPQTAHTKNRNVCFFPNFSIATQYLSADERQNYC